MTPTFRPVRGRAARACALAIAGIGYGLLPLHAHAQSSVVLYGLIDVNVGHYKAGDRAGGGGKWQMIDGTVNGLNGSRWGVRATEDLGGGLKAQAVLEGGLNADSGTLGQGGRAFGRQAFIALISDQWGELRLGRQYILEDYVMVLTDPMGNALVSNPSTAVTNAGRSLPLWLNAPRADNVVQYRTPPRFGGWFGAAQIAPGEGSADRFHGLSGGYLSGPVSLAFSYEWNRSRVTDEDTNKSLTLGANYNFGPFKLLGGVQRNRDLAVGSGNGAAVGVTNLLVTTATSFAMNRSSGATLGVEVPLGARYTVGANYTWVKYQGSGASADLVKAALVGRYAFSKTTSAYAGVSFAAGDVADYILEKRVVNAGLRTSF